MKDVASAGERDASREYSDGAARRFCAWCRKPIPDGKRADAKTCSKACRQARHRFRVAPAGTTGVAPTRSIRVAYADPPYPGLARKYYGTEEVDHKRLVEQLVTDFPDGWGLSTSAKALQSVLDLCPDGVRVCPWVRGSRKSVSFGPRSAWEPLIVAGGRPQRLSVAEDLDDVLLWGGRQPSHPDALVGMKPAAFCEWMFRMLGLLPGDELVDLFPGSGAVERAWELYTSDLPSGTTPSRLAEAQASLEGATTHPSRQPGRDASWLVDERQMEND